MEYRNGLIFKGYFYEGRKNGHGLFIYGTQKYKCLYIMDNLVGELTALPWKCLYIYVHNIYSYIIYIFTEYKAEAKCKGKTRKGQSSTGINSSYPSISEMWEY